eukprot:scaffold314210_cov30-Tisochrysis_lutea.AAC.1
MPEAEIAGTTSPMPSRPAPKCRWKRESMLGMFSLWAPMMSAACGPIAARAQGTGGRVRSPEGE